MVNGVHYNPLHASEGSKKHEANNQVSSKGYTPLQSDERGHSSRQGRNQLQQPYCAA